jgi:uncharacterized DUF497 family protein
MFNWDLRKAQRNWRKHGVSFEEAATAFFDPDGLDGEDLDHSDTPPLATRQKQLGSLRIR